MTPNEKAILKKLEEIEKASTLTLARTVGVSAKYANDLCKKLCEKGDLKMVSPGAFPIYSLAAVKEEEVQEQVEAEQPQEEQVVVEQVAEEQPKEEQTDRAVDWEFAK